MERSSEALPLATLLDELSLSHLALPDTAAALNERLLDGGRPALLAHLKACGVEKLAERQKLANGLGRAQREGRLPGPRPPSPPPGPPPPRPGPKRKVLCLHGGASSGEIMSAQLAAFRHGMGDEYEFVFANGPTAQKLDPESKQAKALAHYFEGLPVLKWFDLLDRQSGEQAPPGGFHNATLGRRRRADEERGDALAGLVRRAEEEEERAAAKAEAGATASGEGGEGGEAAKAGSPGFGQLISLLNGSTHEYTGYAEAFASLAAFVRSRGPFEGIFGFSQGANLMAVWLALCEAGVLDASWAAPKWVVCCCATQWGWVTQFDSLAAELAAAIGPALARQPEELLELKAAAGAAQSERLRGGKLMTALPLGVPSLHLIGAKDAGRAMSAANVELYADEPLASTADVFGGRSLRAPLPGQAANPTDALRVVMEHPNDHMPPRQMEFVEAVKVFARRWD